MHMCSSPKPAKRMEETHEGGNVAAWPLTPCNLAAGHVYDAAPENDIYLYSVIRRLSLTQPSTFPIELDGWRTTVSNKLFHFPLVFQILSIHREL